MKKSDVLKLMETMPDEIDPEDLMYRIYVLEKIERAEAEVARGEFVSHEEVMRRIDQWLK